MVDLLAKVDLPTSNRPGHGVPLMLELPVPDTGPFLVTSTRGLVWVDRAMSGPRVRSAFRCPSPNPDALNLEVLRAVAARGARDAWGCVWPLTDKGLANSIGHLIYHGFSDIVAVTGPGVSLAEQVADVPEVTDILEAPWLPSGTAFLVPRDRAFLGTASEISGHGVLLVVHNPSRALAVLGPIDGGADAAVA